MDVNLWAEYEQKYKSDPENVIQLFNFCKQELKLPGIGFQQVKKLYDRHQKLKRKNRLKVRRSQSHSHSPSSPYQISLPFLNENLMSLQTKKAYTQLSAGYQSQSQSPLSSHMSIHNRGRSTSSSISPSPIPMTQNNRSPMCRTFQVSRDVTEMMQSSFVSASVDEKQWFTESEKDSKKLKKRSSLANNPEYKAYHSSFVTPKPKKNVKINEEKNVINLKNDMKLAVEQLRIRKELLLQKKEHAIKYKKKSHSVILKHAILCEPKTIKNRNKKRSKSKNKKRMHMVSYDLSDTSSSASTVSSSSSSSFSNKKKHKKSKKKRKKSKSKNVPSKTISFDKYTNDCSQQFKVNQRKRYSLNVKSISPVMVAVDKEYYSAFTDDEDYDPLDLGGKQLSAKASAYKRERVRSKSMDSSQSSDSRGQQPLPNAQYFKHESSSLLSPTVISIGNWIENHGILLHKNQNVCCNEFAENRAYFANLENAFTHIVSDEKQITNGSQISTVCDKLLQLKIEIKSLENKLQVTKERINNDLNTQGVILHQQNHILSKVRKKMMEVGRDMKRNQQLREVINIQNVSYAELIQNVNILQQKLQKKQRKHKRRHRSGSLKNTKHEDGHGYSSGNGSGSGNMNILKPSHTSSIEDDVESVIPQHFLCPITHEIMSNPVVTIDGYVYEMSAIEAWFSSSDISPLTGQKLGDKRLTPLHMLRTQIEMFMNQNPHLLNE